MTTTTTGSSLDHAIGADGLVSIRLRDGDVRAPGRRRRRPSASATAAAATSPTMFAIELGDGSAVAARPTGDRTARRVAAGAHPDLEIDLPAAGDGRRRDGERRHRGRRPARRPALPDDVGRHHAARASAAGSPSRPSRATSTSAPPARRDVDRPDRVGRRRAARRRRFARSTSTTTSGDLKVAGRLAGPGPVRDRDRQRRRAPGAGRRRPDRDGDAVGRPALRARRPDRGRPRAPLARRSAAAGHWSTFRSMSGDLQRRPPDGRAGAADAGPRGRAARRTRRAAGPAAAADADAPSRARRRRAERRHRGRLRGRPAADPALARARRDRRAEAGRRLEALDDGEPVARPVDRRPTRRGRRPVEPADA